MTEHIINQFKDDYEFLSNFYPSHIAVYEMGTYSPRLITFPTVEHAFQASKTTNPQEQQAIRGAKTPREAKRLGRKVQLRPDWDDLRVRRMQYLLRVKFFSHALLMAKLVATDQAVLVEGNTWRDTFWGVCDGQGRNILGNLLMQIRSECRELITDAAYHHLKSSFHL